MKKLVFILFVMLIVPSIGYSEDELNFNTNKNDRVISDFIVPDAKWASNIRVVCIDGHKFLYHREIFSVYDTKEKKLTNSFVQMFEERDGKSLPAKC